MSKLPGILAFTLTTSLLLAGCSLGSPDEPAADTATPSDSPSPSEAPTQEATETDEAEATEPSTQPSAVPTAEPTTAAPVPTDEPSTDPEDPFVPPPHGEPNPLEPAPGDPFVPPPHGEPNPFPNSPQQGPGTGGGSVAHPQPGWPGPAINIVPGTLTISGSGYAPGERIEVILGAPHTDQQLLDQSTVYAGPDGSYTFDIYIGPELAGAEYGLMTVAPDRGQWAAEQSKRFLSLRVSPNP